MQFWVGEHTSKSYTCISSKLCCIGECFNGTMELFSHCLTAPRGGQEAATLPWSFQLHRPLFVEGKIYVIPYV